MVVRPQSSGSPFVSVIVPHLDDVVRLSRLMSALSAQTWPRDAFEIIVADNGSGCGIDVVRAAARGARVVAAPERGAGPARNHALAFATGSILAFTDSDCLPDPDWLAQGVAALAAADFVGGAMTVTVGDAARPSPSEAFELVFAFDNERYVAQLGFSVTANLFVRRDVMAAVGGFRTGVPEDLGWCRRARALGYRIGYASGATVQHPAREGFEALARKWRRLTDEAFADWCDGGQSRALWALRALGVLVSPVWDGARVARSSKLRGAGQRMVAAAVLLRLRALRSRWMMAQAFSPNTRVTARAPDVPLVQTGPAQQI
ncbi:MAG: glycosyltransferase [Hyphomicrobiaceae bacterium]